MAAGVFLLILGGEARAQCCRVEGTVRWADGAPAVGLAVVVPDLKLRTTTDERGQYHLEGVKPGIRVSVEAALGTRVLGRAYGLVTLRVERIDLQLEGTSGNPNEPPQSARVVHLPTATFSSTGDAPSGRETQSGIAVPLVGPDGVAVRQSVQITGTVRGAQDLPLPGATVSVVGTTFTAVTDENGRYSLGFSHGADRFILLAEMADHQSGDTVVTTSPTVTADFALRPAFSSLITVLADIPMLNTTDDVSRIQLSPEQVAVLPSLGERDIFRAFQLLPGVSSNETSSGLHVRGGTPDQNLVSFDGFRIYHVDHLFGYFSAFNMDAVEHAELSKGGFDAKYGGALSSVLDIAGRSGSTEKIGGRAGVSLLSANGLFETPLFGDRGSALVAYRRSFQGPLYNKIMNLFDNSTAAPRPPGAAGGAAPPAGVPPAGFGGGRFGATFDTQPSSDFYDLNAKMLARPSNRDTLTLAVYKGNDNLDNSRSLSLPTGFLERLTARGIDLSARGIDLSNPTLDISDVRDSGNTGVGGTWGRQWTPRVRSDVSVGFSRYQDVRDRSSQFGSNATPSAEANHLDDLTFKASVPITLAPGHTLEGGIEVTSNDYAYALQSGTRPVAPPEGGTAPAVSLANVLNQTGNGRLTALFVQDRWLVGSKLLLVPGVRFTRFDRTGTQYSDPRLAVSYFISERVKLKAATGRYHQFVSQVTREDVLQGNRQFWSLADGDALPVSTATHLIGGASYQRGDFLFDVEVFRKELSALTQFAPRLFGASGEVDYRDFFYHGDGLARGLELLVQKRTGRHTGWVSYTNSSVRESFPTLETEPFPGSQDQRHEVKLVNVYEFGGWTGSGTWVYGSGKPYTEPVGFESLAPPDGFPAGFPGFSIDRIVVGPKNGARLPAYHRLDVAVHREFALGNGPGKGLLSLTAFNLYNRKNVWYKEFNVVDGEIAENNIRLMGLTLNASFGVTF
jgi:hypothetical protein